MWEGAFLESMAKAGWSATALERQVENGKVTGNSGGTSYQTIIARAVEKCVIPPHSCRAFVGSTSGPETYRQDKNFRAGNVGAGTA
jgi:hypothetical protein